MRNAKQWLTMLFAMSALTLTTTNVTADDHGNKEATKKIIIERIASADTEDGKLSEEIAARLQAHGIDLETLDIDIDAATAGDKKVIVMRANKDAPMHSEIRVFADEHKMVDLPDQTPLSNKAADCVLSRLAKLQTSDAVWLLREACQTLHP